jgi:hypothetical protein
MKSNLAGEGVACTAHERDKKFLQSFIENLNGRKWTCMEVSFQELFGSEYSSSELRGGIQNIPDWCRHPYSSCDIAKYQTQQSKL